MPRNNDSGRKSGGAAVAEMPAMPRSAGHTPAKAPTSHRTSRALAPRFGIGETNLAIRREFIRLNEDDRQVLMRLESWADREAAEIAPEFYDWQFSFGPTRTFFEEFARSRNLTLDALRDRLESTQAGYIRSIFAGARTNWGLAHFKERLYAGWLHDQINLPFKWYIGSYIELQRLHRIHLRRHIKDARVVSRAEEGIWKVLNYDIQAIGDSFQLNTLESMGLSVDGIAQAAGADKTEGLLQVKDAIHILIEQCTALAEGRLNDPVLERSEPCAGRFGEAFAAIRENFRGSMVRISQSAAALSASAEELTAVSQQMSANAEETAVQANVVANASDDVSKRVAVVATSAEEMQVSIRDIWRPAWRVTRSAPPSRPTPPCSVWASPARASARSSRSSPPSPSRQTCWPSTPPSRRRARAKLEKASRW